MYQFKGMNDTIVAISTAMAPGGIGIVRLSGSAALAVADKMFVAKNEKAGKPSEFKSHTVHYGHVFAHLDNGQGELIDEVLLTVMRAPQSYTVEDVVEISCHGGLVPLRRILSLSIDLGARLAEPGEFTKRAFLNGRIDLTQAEAVLDIIRAKTEAFLKVSTNQLKGELTLELESIRVQLMNIYVELEAVVNFPEDDIDEQERTAILAHIEKALARIESLLMTSEQGRVLKEGVKVVICGKPNVGKSSLLNVLLQQPRAIVSDVAGTTRDTIEEALQVDGIPFQLVDTAGILKPRDAIEQEAVKRSRLYIEQADVVLFVLDGSVPIAKEDRELFSTIQDKNVVIVVNKSDLVKNVDGRWGEQLSSSAQAVVVSALKHLEIEKLKEVMVHNILHGTKVDTQGLLVTNMRHLQSLKNAAQALRRGLEGFKQNVSFEFISEDVKLAVNELDAITGRNIDADLLDKIFSDFCIGK